ncbi:hypothetical protein IV203_008831 [Nitzschia inconspicua]|uniref:Uncharacterized protein n=1 Tax=Nitzschia inconspicua TaxID=303405 RepID=A0A9K3PMH7_9STRA|nr:hypothetical protein IV203_008831 [Nitzschia inconspicua]
MGAPSKNLSDGIKGTEHHRRMGRRSRSSSSGTESMMLSPSVDSLRSSDNQSGVPERTETQNNSFSKKERTEDGVIRNRSNSKDKQSLDSETSSGPSSKDRKSYLSRKPSEKIGSKGRKSSVLGSLNAFLDEESSKPRGNGRSRDAQSVISSASSRRRRRSYTPSSASVVGGLSVTREELRLLRRSRSSSAGPLDRMMQEQKQARSSREEKSTKETSRVRGSSSRRNDPSKEPHQESNSRRDGRRSSDHSKIVSGRKKETSRSRTRSTSVSRRDEHHHPSISRTPTKTMSAGSVTLPSAEHSKSPTIVSRDRNSSTVSPGNGAEVPPGFPVAAVDSRVNSKTERVLESQDSSTVLDSTTRLRQRKTSETRNLDNPEEENTRRRRRSFLGNTKASSGMEKQEEGKIHSPSGTEGRGKLKGSKSETDKRGNLRPSRRHSTEMGVTSAERKKSIFDSEITTNSVSNSGENITKTKNVPGQARRPERQRSNRRTQSPGHLTTKSPARKRNASMDAEEIGGTDLSRNLSKASEMKNSSQSTTRKGSSQSSPAIISDRNSGSTERRRIKRSSSKTSEIPFNKPVCTMTADTEKNLHDKPVLSRFERFNTSTDSLAVDLLAHSPGVNSIVTNVNQLFGDDGVQEVGEKEQDTLSSSSSSSSDIMNISIVSSEVDPTRLSWVELPLFNPGQLLVKTADHDGTNEISELSSHVRGMKFLDDPVKMLSQLMADEEEKEKKSNPSLQAAIDKDKAEIKATTAQDDKTIVTTTTSTSDATMKTTNRDRTVKKPAKAKVKNDDLGSAQDSITFDQLDVAEGGEHGSSGSLSRTSRRSQGNGRGNKGNLENKESISESNNDVGKPKLRVPSRTAGGSIEKARDRSNSIEKARDRSNSIEKARDRSKLRDGSCRSKLQRKPSERKGTGRTKSPSSSCEQSIAVAILDGECHEPLKKKTSKESPGTLSRKKSYLNKRKIVKADKDESTEAKKAVKSSLDMFLKRIEQAPPVVKDDNRSVYSSMQDRDRRRRSMLQKEKDRGKSTSRCIRRLNPRKSLESAFDTTDGGESIDTDADSMSITSAPTLRTRGRSSLVKQLKEGSPQVESQRPVVDLKKTHFSIKLTKLHVAF